MSHCTERERERERETERERQRQRQRQTERRRERGAYQLTNKHLSDIVHSPETDKTHTKKPKLIRVKKKN